MSIDQLIPQFGHLSRTLLVGSSLAVALSFGCGDKAATSYSEASNEKSPQPKEECFIPGQSGRTTIMMIPKYTYDESGKLTGQIGKGGQSTEYTLNIYKKIPCVKPDFVNNSNSTITDRAHGLMWTIEATPDERSLGGAVEACKNVKNAGGYNDWRVPTIEELWTLWTEETPCHFPSIFQGKCWRYWTSTPAPAGWTDNYFAVYFESSYPMLQAVRYQGNWMPSTVRCVRVFSSDSDISVSGTSANSGSVKLNDLLRQSAKSGDPDSDPDGNPRLDSKMLARLMSGEATKNSAECDLKKFNKNSEYVDCSTSQRVFVRAFNIDDTGEVLLDGRRILQVGYREDSGYVDITSHIKSGMNFLRFIAKNQLGGYTWGLEIKCDDALKYLSAAGLAGKLGARKNDYTKTQQTIFDCTLPIILKNQ
ncbi:DUF1566 domain-containing protein [Candidatus Woesearchaeota archaeon]|nr:DUF1566 domain-containing protein [Candidatus Woesearchaeota archaeon]